MTPSRPPTCELLAWDTAFFGRRIGRLYAAALAEADMPAVHAWRRAQQVECLYCLAAAGDAPTRRTLEQHGFALVDVRLTMRCALSAAEPPAPPPGVGIRPATLDDLPALRAIAAGSHDNTRFFQDRHFPPARARALYATWIENSLRGAAELVLAAEAEGRVVGYCTGRVEAGHTAHLALCAVAGHARGRGIGRALVTALQAALWRQGAQSMVVVTQGGSGAAYGLYRRCGFITDDVELWYHGWFGDADNTDSL